MVDTRLYSHRADWSARLAFESAATRFSDGWDLADEALCYQSATEGEIFHASSSVLSDSRTEPPSEFLGSGGTWRTYCMGVSADSGQTVLGTVSNWRELRPLDDRVTFHIALDGEVPAALQKGIPDFIDIVVVPASFTARKAKYKARALEYFRRSAKLRNDDWVLHLDEETQIDAFAVRTCLDFIERTRFDIGMVSHT